MFVLNYHGHKKVMFWNRLRWLPTILAQQKYNEKCQENSTIGNLSGEGFTFRCNWYWKSTVVLMNYRQDTDKREECSLAWIEGGKLPFVVCPGAPNGNFRENICSEDDLRTRIFGTFFVKFIACLPLLRFSNIYKVV